MISDETECIIGFYDFIDFNVGVIGNKIEAWLSFGVFRLRFEQNPC